MVTNGQRANQTTFNNAFMSRTTNTSTVGKVDLNNAAPESGTAVANTQRELNSLASFLGKALNIVKDALPAWASDDVGAPGDNVFQRVDALTIQGARRCAIQNIGNGATTVVVAFATDWPDALYVIDFCFENVLDSTPIFLQGMVTARDVDGFTVLLNAPTDTPNYKMNYSVKKAA